MSRTIRGVFAWLLAVLSFSVCAAAEPYTGLHFDGLGIAFMLSDLVPPGTPAGISDALKSSGRPATINVVWGSGERAWITGWGGGWWATAEAKLSLNPAVRSLGVDAQLLVVEFTIEKGPKEDRTTFKGSTVLGVLERSKLNELGSAEKWAPAVPEKPTQSKP